MAGLHRTPGGWVIADQARGTLVEVPTVEVLENGCLLATHMKELYWVSNYRVSSQVCGAVYLVPVPWEEVPSVDRLLPGKGGTVDSRELSTLAMGDGSGKQTRVIRDGAVMMYVGIGWVEERRATPEDTDTLPMVVYLVPTVEHMARA